VPTFAYEFNDENAPERYLPPVSFPYGAAHESEVQYLFGLPTAPITATLTAQQQQLAATATAPGRDGLRDGAPLRVLGFCWIPDPDLKRGIPGGAGDPGRHRRMP
jgi:hypothetical protein